MNEKSPRLLIGKITYTNLFPIFYMLEGECDCSGYEFIEGVPSSLNRMLRYGEIDISPSSSIEYLRYEDGYFIIEGHSISSRGPIGSIFLFSKRPIERLDGLTVFTSTQSESSVALLDIILRKFYKVECLLRPMDFHLQPPAFSLDNIEAYLLIGDDALKTKKTVTSYKLQVTSKNQNFELGTWNSELIYIYDLGELWYKNTGLPFVFALWIARKDRYTEKTELLERLRKDLNKAKRLVIKNLNKIAQDLRPLLLNRYSLLVTEEELVSYWKGISYDFGEEHKKGLELFREYSEKLGLLNKIN